MTQVAVETPASVPEAHLRAYQRLAELSLRLAGARDLDSVFHALREFVAFETPMSGLFLSRYDPVAKLRYCIYAHTEGEDLDPATLPPMPLTNSPHSRCVQTGEVIVTEDFQAAMAGQPRVNVGLERDARLPQSSLVVPLRVHDQVTGAMEIQSTRSGVFTPDHVIVLQLAGNLAALAREDVHAHEAESEAVRALERQASELEGKVQLRTRELAAKNRELESFSWTVAHDLRGPLRGLSALSDALLEDQSERLGEDGKRDVEAMRRAADRMGRLVEDLLQFAQAAQGGLRRELIDLGAIARETLRDLQAQAPRPNARIVVQENLLIEADATLARVLLDNLLSNAWKYSAKQPQTVIEVGMRALDGSRVFFVRDEGVGFDPAQATRVFSAFQRAHDAKDYEGSGIGLATAQRIVERHGGRIWAQSEPGKGATFFFTLSEDPPAKA